MNTVKKTRQQITDEQINYLLGDVEKTLEDYRQNIELKEKQLWDAKKYCFPPSKVTINQWQEIKN